MTFRGGVDLVTATVSVRDRKGRIIKDLKQADFEIIDSGVAREIRTFESGESPVSLAVLVDISGSMAVGGNIGRARTAVTVGMAALRSGADEAALYTFDSKLQEVVPFTTDLARLRRVTLQGKPWGQTSLYDAVAETARRAADRPNRHRAVFVITDGVDTGSRLTGPEVSAIASSIDVPVYLLVVVNPVDHAGRGVRPGAGRQQSRPDGDAWRPGAVDGRRFPSRQHPRSHRGGHRRSVRRASSPVP